MKDLKITVKTVFGLEEALKEEINELGYENVEILNRAIQVSGTWEDVYRLNYRCRLAISVLVEIDSFFIRDEDDLYKKAKRIDWPSYFDKDKTFAVKGAVFSNVFRHSQYPMLLVKDAIADVFRDKEGERPNVNVKAPQVMFDVYIKEKNVVISLNTSGLPLFQRGYRQETGEAPINEVLAAGLLRLSGWDRKSTLIDPMCGAGTIAIEAALWAADIPAMIERSHYAFKNFKSYDEEAWERVQEEGNKRPIDLGFDILAYDIDGEMVQKARRNSRVAPIGNMIQFERQDALTLTAPDEKGTLIVNPPYEERMGENVEELYENLGNLFKHSFVGYDCWIISSNMDAFKRVGLKPSKRIKVFNGNLEASFRQYQIFEGTHKEQFVEEIGEEEVSSKDETPKEERAPRRERPTKKFDRSDRRGERSDRRQDRSERSYGRSDNKYGGSGGKYGGSDRKLDRSDRKPERSESRYGRPDSKYGRPDRKYGRGGGKYGGSDGESRYAPRKSYDRKEEGFSSGKKEEKKDNSSYKDKIERMRKRRGE